MRGECVNWGVGVGVGCRGEKDGCLFNAEKAIKI